MMGELNPPSTVGDCIIWKKYIDRDGYGITYYKGKVFKAHRMAYAENGGTLIKGMVIDHICKNRSCINPAHLRQVTPRQNVLENSDGLAAKNKAKTHCSKGHLLTPDNLVENGLRVGRRNCKICWEKKDLKYKAEHGDKIRAYQREWRRKHKDRLNENNRNKRKQERSSIPIK